MAMSLQSGNRARSDDFWRGINEDPNLWESFQKSKIARKTFSFNGKYSTGLQ